VLRNNDAHRLVDENRDRAKLLLLLPLLALQLPVRARAPSPPVADIITNDELLIVLGKEEAAPLPVELRELDRARLSPKPSSSSSSKYHPPRALLPPSALVGVVPLPALEKEWLLLARRKPAGAVEGTGDEEAGGGPLEEGWRLNMCCRGWVCEWERGEGCELGEAASRGRKWTRQGILTRARRKFI